jgi:hypothetical protein
MDACIIHKKTVNNNDAENLQIDLGRLGDWVLENGMNINPGKSKAVTFMRAWVKDPLNYSLMDQVIPEGNSCKCVGIKLRSELSWTDHFNYMAKIDWKALYFTIRILKKGNSNMKRLAYIVLVHLIIKYGAGCWDPFREGQINLLDQVQKKQQNLQVLQIIQTGKLWRSVER